VGSGRLQARHRRLRLRRPPRSRFSAGACPEEPKGLRISSRPDADPKAKRGPPRCAHKPLGKSPSFFLSGLHGCARGGRGEGPPGWFGCGPATGLDAAEGGGGGGEEDEVEAHPGEGDVQERALDLRRRGMRGSRRKDRGARPAVCRRRGVRQAHTLKRCSKPTQTVPQNVGQKVLVEQQSKPFYHRSLNVAFKLSLLSIPLFQVILISLLPLPVRQGQFEGASEDVKIMCNSGVT
jgi:hypothetical protein